VRLGGALLPRRRVGLTIAEFVPRDVLALAPLLDDLPLTR
jgi:hypothetical protein